MHKFNRLIKIITGAGKNVKTQSGKSNRAYLWLLYLLISVSILSAACALIKLDYSAGKSGSQQSESRAADEGDYSPYSTSGEGAYSEGSASATENSSAADSNKDENQNLPVWWYMPDKDSFYPVARVVDGDTIVLKIDGYHRKIRLIGIDAPESVHNDPEKNTPEGEAASLYLENLLEGRDVRVEYDVSYRDRFDRDLCYCFLPDGTFINLAIVRAGHANLMTMPPNVKHATLFKQALADAQKDKLGMWR